MNVFDFKYFDMIDFPFVKLEFSSYPASFPEPCQFRFHCSISFIRCFAHEFFKFRAAFFSTGTIPSKDKIGSPAPLQPATGPPLPDSGAQVESSNLDYILRRKENLF